MMFAPPVLVLLLVLPFAVCAQRFTPVDTQDAVTFSIKNFGASVNGSFQGLSGTILFDPEEPEETAIHVSVKAETVQTGIDMRDRHLRKTDYFDAAKFPVITFVSSSVRKGSKAGEFIVTGTLTLKGKSKAIIFPFSVTKAADGGLIFAGSFSINRRDFGVGGWSVSLSDEAVIKLKVPVRNAESGN